MADFTFDVVFNVDELNKNISGVSGGGSQAGTGGLGMLSNIAKGFKLALTATGIIGILTNLRVVLDTIGFVLGIISSLLGFVVAQLIQFIVPFFKDPTRALLSLVVYLINGIIGGIEFMLNALLGALTFGKVGGFGENMIEIPRLQEEVVLSAYDELKRVLQDESNASADDITDATRNFTMSFINGFMTDEELQQWKIDNQTKLDKTKTATDSAFDSLTSSLNYIENKFNSLQEAASRGGLSSPTTSTSQRDAYNYLTTGKTSSVAEQNKSKYDNALKFVRYVVSPGNALIDLFR